MPKYSTELRNRRVVAERTTARCFEEPSGFEFKAGQLGEFALINPPETGDEGDARTFSIASAPVESELMAATRIRDSAFKQVWKAMRLGSKVEVAGSSGSLKLHQDAARPAVFLARGIGITPFRRIIVQAQ